MTVLEKNLSQVGLPKYGSLYSHREVLYQRINMKARTVSFDSLASRSQVSTQIRASKGSAEAGLDCQQMIDESSLEARY